MKEQPRPSIKHGDRFPTMDDWDYCVKTLPKVSRTFALNISVLKGPLHRSILTAYLFCRIVDTIEDAAETDPKTKIRLLLEFTRILQSPTPAEAELASWIDDCRQVDGSVNDLDLLANTRRVFNIFYSLDDRHQAPIIQSVSEMCRGMAYFQTKFDGSELTLLESVEELEEYCYYVAGVVGEMLCGLFLAEMPDADEATRKTMQDNAVSFGLGLQMTNISKDLVVDRGRGWSYIPKQLITHQGLTVESFGSPDSLDASLKILEQLLLKTSGHLQDALEFTLAIPRRHYLIRLFCIWPLWMAMETVAILHNNKALLNSDDPVKISRRTVRRILRRTPVICVSNFLLKRSFKQIDRNRAFTHPPKFNLNELKERLTRIPFDKLCDSSLTV